MLRAVNVDSLVKPRMTTKLICFCHSELDSESMLRAVNVDSLVKPRMTKKWDFLKIIFFVRVREVLLRVMRVKTWQDYF